MAAVFRSSLGKTVHRALSLEENLSLNLSQQRWRLLHAGRTTGSTHLAGPSRAKPFLKSPKVDPLVNKIDEVAKMTALAEYTQSLVQEEKTKVVSPNLLGIALPWLMATCFVGLFTAGFRMGFSGATEEKYLESGRKK